MADPVGRLIGVMANSSAHLHPILCGALTPRPESAFVSGFPGAQKWGRKALCSPATRNPQLSAQYRIPSRQCADSAYFRVHIGVAKRQTPRPEKSVRYPPLVRVRLPPPIPILPPADPWGENH